MEHIPNLAAQSAAAIVGNPEGRQALEALVEALIAILDDVDGDELDGSLDEDDFIEWGNCAWSGPGCPLADGCGEDDDPAGDPLDAGEDDGIDYGAEAVADPTAVCDHLTRIRSTCCNPVVRRWRERGIIQTETVRHELVREPIAPTKRQLLKRKRGVPSKVRP